MSVHCLRSGCFGESILSVVYGTNVLPTILTFIHVPIASLITVKYLRSPSSYDHHMSIFLFLVRWSAIPLLNDRLNSGSLASKHTSILIAIVIFIPSTIIIISAIMIASKYTCSVFFTKGIIIVSMSTCWRNTIYFLNPQPPPSPLHLWWFYIFSGR